MLQPEPTMNLYETNKTIARQTHTCDPCAHTNILDVYIVIQLQHYSSIVACSGYTSRDSV